MKKTYLFITAALSCLSGWSQSTDTNAENQDMSLDFTYNDITYTVIDEGAKTCKTKAGSFIHTVGDQSRPFTSVVYGNSVSGDLNIPEKVSKDDGTEYTVVAIGELGFTGATTVTIPNTVTEVGAYAFFNDDNITQITFPESVTTIGNYALAECSALTSVTLPSGLTAIPTYMFYRCTLLTDVNIPATLTSIGDYAFQATSITEVTLPTDCLSLGTNVFYTCRQLSSVTLPENLVSLPPYAFGYCTALESITLPAGLSQIGYYSFANCSALKQIQVENLTPPSISPNTFSGLALDNISLNVYKSALNAYSKNSLWKGFNISPIQIAATGISIDKTALTLNEGLSSVLVATLEPIESTDEINWSTSAPSIATVEDGKVIAHSSGSAIITATSGAFSATCNVTVISNPTSYVRVVALTDSVFVGDEPTLTARVVPSTITTPISWTSSNPDIASIDANSGKLQALGAGQVIITATCGQMTGKYTLSIYAIEAQSVTLSQESLTMNPGDTETLIATIDPDNTTDKTVIWTSNDENVLTVIDGTVTAINPGRATVTATCGLVTAYCTVLVNEVETTGLVLNASELTLKVNQSSILTATVEPANATNKQVIWSTADDATATVSPDGIVTAVALGSTTITATCGTVTATCDVTVEATPANEIVISMSSVTLKAGQSQQLSASVPEETTDKTITWTTGNSLIAEVSADGLVTAMAVGETEITATCGAVSATCSVIVEATPVEQIVLSDTQITVNTGSTITVTATVLPETATDKTVTWTIDPSTIATVNEGTIEGIEPGQAILTATAGDISAICNVTVLNPAKSVTLNYQSLELEVGDIEDLIATPDPVNTTDQPLWSSSNTDVAVVSSNGIVEALSTGTATITVEYGQAKATCEVNVSEQSTSIHQVIADENGIFTVYNLAGVLLFRSENKDDLHRLAPGIYIVNNMKVLIEK